MKKYAISTIALILFNSVLMAEDDITVEIAQAAKNIYMLTGQGGNIAISIGEDGTIMVDDQFAPLSEKINTAIQSVGGSRPNFVINTHWHADHTGGNENFSHQGSFIIAHEKVRERLIIGGVIKALNREYPPAGKETLPEITYQSVMKLYFNSEEIVLFHIDAGHTDGDTVVHFKTSNVIHTGDLFFNGMYPFIDASSGGDIRGLIKAIDLVLEQADESTVIIPGHGKISDKKELQEYREMLATIERRVQALLDDGKTLAEIKQANPLKGYESKATGFIKADTWIEQLYAMMK